MATVNVNFRLDKEVKEEMEKACEDMGLTMSAAFTIFATTVVRERRIPFAVTADPFYSEANMHYLDQKMSAYKNGTLNTSEHGLMDE